MTTKGTTDKLLAEWFWTDRWNGSSAFLLPLEPRGFYREMLTQSWRRGARLPNDFSAIRRAIGCTRAEWKRCWPLVAPYWKEQDGFLVNETQQEIYRQTKAIYARAAERARKGGLAKARGKTAPAQAVLEHVLEVCPLSPSPLIPLPPFSDEKGGAPPPASPENGRRRRRTAQDERRERSLRAIDEAARKGPRERE